MFLGLGFPWVIASTWGVANPLKVPTLNNGDGQVNGEYYVPAGSLGFSVVVFIACAIVCIIFLIYRRYKFGGELGGTQSGRVFSCIFLCMLWGVYIIMSILQTKKVGGLDTIKFNISDAHNKCTQP